MARINLSPEQLRAMYAAPEQTFDPSKVTQAYATGMTLQDSIAAKKAEREKAEMDLKKEIEQALAQKKFAQTATTPVATTKSLIEKVKQPKQAQVYPLNPMDMEAFSKTGQVQATDLSPIPAKDVNLFESKQVERQIPRTPEEIQADEAQKQQSMKDQAIAMNPTEYVKSLLKPDTTSARQMQLINANVPGMGMTFVNIDKVNKKAYDLEGNDITHLLGGKVEPGFAPASIVGTSGVTMIPRREGTYRAAAPTEKGQGIKSTAQLMPMESSILEKTKEDFNTDPSVKVAIAKQADYDMADSVIGIGNWVGDAAVLSVAAKGLGRDVGNLSTEEQRRYRMSPALVDSIKTKASLWVNGVIRPEDRDAFKEAVRVMKEKNLDILNNKREQYGTLASTRVPNLDPTFAKDYIYTPSTMQQFSGKQEMTPEKKARLEFLRQKKAQGTLGR